MEDSKKSGSARYKHFDVDEDAKNIEAFLNKFRKQALDHLQTLEEQVNETCSRKKKESRRDKDPLSRLRREVSDLKSEFEKVKEELDKMPHEKRELESKLENLNLELKNEKIENEAAAKELVELEQEVVQLETDQETLQRRLIEKKDGLQKIYSYYKNYLNCHMSYEEPFFFTFKFTNDSNAKWIRFSSDDFKHWDFIDSDLEDVEKAEVIRILEEERCVTKAVARARQFVLKKSLNNFEEPM